VQVSKKAQKAAIVKNLNVKKNIVNALMLDYHAAKRVNANNAQIIKIVIIVKI
jgi:hypothetical protein